jgi:hypothetical protein
LDNPQYVAIHSLLTPRLPRAALALADGYDVGYAPDNEQWASAYEVFANAMGYDPKNGHWASAYSVFMNATAAAAVSRLCLLATSSLILSDTLFNVTLTSRWSVLFPLVWLWRTLPFWRTYSVLLILAGFIWSPRASHIVEAFFNALRTFADLLKSVIPNPIDIHRFKKVKIALALAQHEIGIAERATSSEIELREAADIDKEGLQQKLEEPKADNAKLKRNNVTLRRPLNIETLQLRIRELNQQLHAATRDVPGKIYDATASLHQQIDAVKKPLFEKYKTIKLCYRSIARLEETAKSTERQSKLDQNMVEDLKRINCESCDETKQPQSQVKGIIKEANLTIASRDKRLETLDASQPMYPSHTQEPTPLLKLPSPSPALHYRNKTMLLQRPSHVSQGISLLFRLWRGLLAW